MTEYGWRILCFIIGAAIGGFGGLMAGTLCKVAHKEDEDEY